MSALASFICHFTLFDRSYNVFFPTSSLQFFSYFISLYFLTIFINSYGNLESDPSKFISYQFHKSMG